jgi:hypothetical protein
MIGNRTRTAALTPALARDRGAALFGSKTSKTTKTA